MLMLNTQSSPASPLSILNASPHGHIAQAQSPNSSGLLSLADNSNTSPRNGHNQLVCICAMSNKTKWKVESVIGIAFNKQEWRLKIYANQLTLA